jgi:hypothetical protein
MEGDVLGVDQCCRWQLLHASFKRGQACVEQVSITHRFEP